MKKTLSTLLLSALLIGVAVGQRNEIPLIGSKAPSFKTSSTNGDITFPEDFGSSWKILFSHPQDFTPVCSSELLELAYMHNDFDRLNVKIAIISTDDLAQHVLWKKHLEELDYKGRGKQSISFPILDDHRAIVSKEYGMLHEPTSTVKDVRGVFIIDPENTVRSINFYPMQIGRNMAEIVRIVEALQMSDEQTVLTPANWNEGEDVLVPYFPYTKEELAANPELEKEFYSVGNRMWFKKVKQ
jgi:peroxiredoxin (alkyl hydroperoxide reductase subunit C)